MKLCIINQDFFLLLGEPLNDLMKIPPEVFDSFCRISYHKHDFENLQTRGQ